MNLTELQAEVILLTNRPDLVAETLSAIRKATMKMHSIDYFSRDVQEVVLAPATPGFVIQLDLVINAPRFRAVSYLVDNSATTAVNRKAFTEIEPRGLFDEYGTERLNVWYLAGQVLNLKSSTTVSGLLFGYYALPIITPDISYNSWIATEQPYAIVEEAAASIFKMIGNAEMARFYSDLSMQNQILLRQNYLEGSAR